MKKTLSLLLVALFVLSILTGCGSGGSQNTPAGSGDSGGGNTAQGGADLPNITLNLGTMFYDPAASTIMNTDGTTTKYFADLVNERSNGRITVNVHWASVLGGTTELFDQARSGDLDLVFGGAVSSCDVRFGIMNVPGLMDDFDMATALVSNPEGGIYKLLYEIFRDNNIELLSGSIGQFRGIFNNVREIHVPSDCSGLMLRAYADEVVTKYWNGLCNTTILPMSEVYTALQLHTIDGLEHWPTATIANGQIEVLTYYSDLYWQWQANSCIYMSKQKYDSLDSEAQKILRECAYAAAGVKYREVEEANMADAYDYMRENGITIYELTDADRAEWKAYADSLQADFREIVGPDVYDRAFAISAEYRAGR